MADNALIAFAGCLFQSQQTFNHAAHVRRLKTFHPNHNEPAQPGTRSEIQLIKGKHICCSMFVLHIKSQSWNLKYWNMCNNFVDHLDFWRWKRKTFYGSSLWAFLKTEHLRVFWDLDFLKLTEFYAFISPKDKMILRGIN